MGSGGVLPVAAKGRGLASRPTAWLAALVALAAAVRLVAWQRTAALFDDGPVFIYIAQAMSEGDWSAALRHPYHPLYSLATWGMSFALGDLERSAVAVSITAGIASVGLLHAFVRDAFDARTAWIAAAILALHPFAIDFGSDLFEFWTHPQILGPALSLDRGIPQVLRSMPRMLSRGTGTVGFAALSKIDRDGPPAKIANRTELLV